MQQTKTTSNQPRTQKKTQARAREQKKTSGQPSTNSQLQTEAQLEFQHQLNESWGITAQSKAPTQAHAQQQLQQEKEKADDPLQTVFDWRKTLTPEDRSRIITKIATVMWFCLDDTEFPKYDPELLRRARGLEETTMKEASGRTDYLRRLTDHIYKLRRDHQASKKEAEVSAASANLRLRSLEQWSAAIERANEQPPPLPSPSTSSSSGSVDWRSTITEEERQKAMSDVRDALKECVFEDPNEKEDKANEKIEEMAERYVRNLLPKARSKEHYFETIFKKQANLRKKNRERRGQSVLPELLPKPTSTPKPKPPSSKTISIASPSKAKVLEASRILQQLQSAVVLSPKTPPPTIVIPEDEEEESVTLTKTRLKSLFDEAFEQAFSRAKGTQSTPSLPVTVPSTPTILPSSNSIRKQTHSVRTPAFEAKTQKLLTALKGFKVNYERTRSVFSTEHPEGVKRVPMNIISDLVGAVDDFLLEE